MKVSRAFLQDFAYLANYYGWTPADIEEMKAAIRENEEHGRRYITVLARAHRAGYRQTAENGFIRLDYWLIERGMEPLHAAAFEGKRGE
jgi:hypothetical protein